MSTTKETIGYILSKLGQTSVFRARAMFGEYALYANDKVVALVCDDMLYVKICPASSPLEGACEQDAPYPGAKPHYVVGEEQLDSLADLPNILIAIARSFPPKKKKTSKKG